MKSNVSVHRNRPGRKRRVSLLQIVSSVEPTVQIETKTENLNTLPLSLPFFGTDVVEVGVVDIEGKRSIYIRLFQEPGGN